MFTNKSFKFLQDLEQNNNKEWFVNHKSDYQTNIVKPLKELIVDLQTFINIIDVLLETRPVTNKAISTIYRDTRYSKNKLPLKTYIGFNFKKPRPDWKQFPAFIFRINTTGYIFGLTIMKNNADHFYNFRQDIDEDEKYFKNAIKNIDLKDFELWGENYKKYYYKGKNPDLKEWYHKKNLFLKKSRPQTFYNSKKDLIIDIQKTFEKLVPLYQYFNDVFAVNTN